MLASNEKIFLFNWFSFPPTTFAVFPPVAATRNNMTVLLFQLVQSNWKYSRAWTCHGKKAGHGDLPQLELAKKPVIKREIKLPTPSPWKLWFDSQHYSPSCPGCLPWVTRILWPYEVGRTERLLARASGTCSRAGHRQAAVGQGCLGLKLRGGEGGHHSQVRFIEGNCN